MKKAFIGYYTPSEEEFAELWAKGRIVVDANVLLAIYGVSPSTRETLLRLLDAVKERLWIPNHFAWEYHRNRITKILEQVKHYDDAQKNLKRVLEEQFRSRTQHPFVSKAVEKTLEKTCKHLTDGKAEQEKLLESDPNLVRITELFNGRVGIPYNESELNDIYNIARKRFSEKIPPGFKDSDKPEPARYGDYVGWRQLLDFAIKTNASVILVTDDVKEDWWRQEGSRRFGPRPELIFEFRTYCSGLFHMYASDQFLELSGKYIGGPVDPNAISELKERRESEPQSDPRKSDATEITSPIGLKSLSYIADRAQEKPDIDAPKSGGEDHPPKQEES
jgi:hypothetical protein